MDFKSLLDKSWSWIVRNLRAAWRLLTNYIRKPSLAKTAVVTMLAISILPLLIVVTVASIRMNQQVRGTTYQQLTALVNANEEEIAEYTFARAWAMDNLAYNGTFREAVVELISAAAQGRKTDNNLATKMMESTANSAGDINPIFDEVFILNSDMTILAGTNDDWIQQVTGGTNAPLEERVLKDTLNKDASLVAFNILPPAYANQTVLVTARTFTPKGMEQPVTVIGITSSDLFAQMLWEMAEIFPKGRAYFLLNLGNYIGSESATTIRAFPNNYEVTQHIRGLREGNGTRGSFRLNSFNGVDVLGYTRYYPEIDSWLVMEVSAAAIRSEIRLIEPVTAVVLFLVMALAGLVIFIGSKQVVEPILQLTEVAQRLADGNLSARTSSIQRKDEIGLLGSSMNQMADEYEHLYQTMEQQVEHRTSQLRTASEVAQMAISTSNLGDTLERTAELVNERFGYHHTSIYLTEANGIYITLRKASGEIGLKRMEKGERIPVGDPSPVGMAVRNNQPRIIPDTREDPSYRFDETLPDTRCQAAIPIAAGSQVLGVLDIRSNQPDSFTPDDIFVLQTLANQVAGAIQNIRLLETAQVDLEETSLLYKVTRQITQSRVKTDIDRLLIDILPHIPRTNAYLSLEGGDLRVLHLYDASANKVDQGLRSISIPAQKIIQALTPGEMVFVDNIAQPNDFDNILSFFLRRNCKSAAIFPSFETGKLAKIIILGFRAEDRAGQEILQPFANLAEIISTSLDRFNVMGTLQDRLSELQLLANFSQATSAETNLERLYHVLHQQIMQTLGDDLSFAITLYNPKTELIEIPYAYDGRELTSYDPFPLGEGLTSHVIKNRKPLMLTQNTEQRARELGARFVGRPAKSWMGIPLIVAGDLVGAMVVQDLETEERFTQHDLNLITTLAGQIGTSIRNAQLLDEMQDALTAYDSERNLLNTWLQNTPDVIAIKDSEGQYQRVSQALASQFDQDAASLIGKTDFDIFNEGEAARIAETDQAAMHSGRDNYGSVERIQHDENEFWFLTSRIPILSSSGSPVGLLSVRRDITEIKTAESVARQRADEILIAAEIARDSSSILDVDELLHKAVDLIRDRFGYYHASIFLLDAVGEYAVLRESTGEAGRQMKSSGHKLAVGSRSIVGQTTKTAEALIVHDVRDDPNHFPNPLLPDTRAEMAIPLTIGDRVLGALDVQSNKPGVFTPTDVSILSILADQLAVAINNADQFTSTQDMLTKHRLLHRVTATATTAGSLTEAMDAVAGGLISAHIADHAAIMLLANDKEMVPFAMSGYASGTLQRRYSLGQGLVGAAATSRQPVRVTDVRSDPLYIRGNENTLSELVLPIMFGEEFMGVLNLESDRLAFFSENDQEIMTALANNLGAIISNYRLVVQIRRQVERQQTLFNATSRIRRSVDLQTILQTSVEEIGRALGARRANIQLELEGKETSLEPLSTQTRPVPKPGNNGHADDAAEVK